METPTTDIDSLNEVYTTARNKYKPHHIRTLIIAEAPPCALDRYFYFEDVKTQDSLFLEIMGIIYPEMKEKYVKAKRPTNMKQEMLEAFKADGYWLADLCNIPTSIVDGPFADDVESLIAGLEKDIKKDTPIILIKSNVYDLAFEQLKAKGYRVIDERMPFPGSGQQKVFREKFSEALRQAV
jgi:hypothetical protein